MATIATHNGSKICRDHNIRNPKVIEKEKHIDPNGIHETWHDEKLRDAYKRIFGKAQDEYNERQTREERKIKSYYNQVAKDSKKHVGYEMIVGVYGADVDPKVGKEILKEFFEGWQERNRSLELVGVYYHADEAGQPHLHIDYVPVGHGYSKGMSIQNGLNRAFEEIGFKTISSKETAQIQWERRENHHLEDLCRQRGINVERPVVDNSIHYEKEEYIIRKQLEELEIQKNSIQKEIEDLKQAKGPFGRTGPLRAENAALIEKTTELEKAKELLEAVIDAKHIENVELNKKLDHMIELQKEAQPDIDTILERDTFERENYSLKKENASLEQKLKNLLEAIKEILEYIKQHVPELFNTASEIFSKWIEKDDPEPQIGGSKRFDYIFDDDPR